MWFGKKYIVCLSKEEQQILTTIVKKFKGSSEKVRRAQILLKADVNGSNWTDKQIAEAFDCLTKTAENVRERLVNDGFDVAVDG